MSTEQQYRVIGKSGPGVEPVVGMVVRWRHAKGEPYRLGGNMLPITAEDALAAWNAGDYDILEAISPPQAAVATCESWCGLPFGDKRVPPASDHPSMVVESHAVAALCVQNLFVSNCTHPAYCTQACLDRAKAAKGKQGPAKHALCGAVKGLWLCDLQPGHEGMHHCTVADAGGGNWMFWRDDDAPTCIRSACKAPPVAGGVLCAAHAGQVEAAKAGTAPAARCGHTGPLSCGKCADCTAAPVPAPAETRLERWRREHKGYSHGTADPRVYDANVAAMMVGIDGPRGPREPYVPPAPLAAWTPRDLDGDIPNAWEPGGARLGQR